MIKQRINDRRILSPCTILTVVTAANVLTTPAIAAGALAEGPPGPHRYGGSSVNASSYEEAATRAIGRCSEHGPGCHVVKYFSGQCLAVALQIGANGRAWAVRASLPEAQAAVVNACAVYGRPCEVKLSACDTTGIPVFNPPTMPSPPTPPPPAPRPMPPSAPVPTTQSRGCELYPELCP